MLIVASLVFNSSVQFLLSAMSSLYPAADFSLLSLFNTPPQDEIHKNIKESKYYEYSSWILMIEKERKEEPL